MMREGEVRSGEIWVCECGVCKGGWFAWMRF